MTVQGVLIYDLTKSTLYLGLAGFAYGIPFWLFTLYGGVIADKIPKRTLLIITQTSMMFLAFILSYLCFAGIVHPWEILILSFFLGLANAFDAPARIAFVSEMVEKEDLANAVALNTIMVHLASAIGPAVGSLLYLRYGAGLVFSINGISFLAVILALLLMQLKKITVSKAMASGFQFLKEGINHIICHQSILPLIGITAATCLFGISSATLFPAWADKVLHGNAGTNGLLQSSRGFGALISASYIASLGRFKYKGRLLTIGMIGFSVSSLLFAFVNWLPLSLFLAGVSGFFLIMASSLTLALCMTLSEPYFRGRIMSVYSLAFFGIMPIGSLWIGWLGKTIGLAPALIINGSLFFVFIMYIYVKFPKIRKLE